MLLVVLSSLFRLCRYLCLMTQTCHMHTIHDTQSFGACTTPSSFANPSSHDLYELQIINRLTQLIVNLAWQWT